MPILMAKALQRWSKPLPRTVGEFVPCTEPSGNGAWIIMGHMVQSRKWLIQWARFLEMCVFAVAAAGSAARRIVALRDGEVAHQSVEQSILVLDSSVFPAKYS